MPRLRSVFQALLFFAILCCCLSAAVSDEKLIVLDEAPRNSSRFEIGTNGKLYFNGGGYSVLDAQGKQIDRIPAPGAARELVPLPDGTFLAANAHSVGHIALLRADGTEQKILVRRGGNVQSLHSDGTGWTSPMGLAVDFEKKLIFTLDSVAGQRGMADPAWSRIAIFDLDGKFVRDINRWDGFALKNDAEETKDIKRTWYSDIEVDPPRERIFVTATVLKKLLVFSYDGRPVGEVPGQGGIAVFPDGRVAVGGTDAKSIQIYDTDLKPVKTLDVPLIFQLPRAINEGRMDLEADVQGRLFMNSIDAGTLFVRWSSDLAQREEFGPRYLRVQVDFGDTARPAGTPVKLTAIVTGRPEPEANKGWQVMARPSDGSDLRWRNLPSQYSNGSLEFTPPADADSFYEVAVRYGNGPINRADFIDDPYLQRTFAFMPAGATRSLAAFPATGRRVYQQGETIGWHIVQRGGDGAAKVQVTLEKGAKVVARADLTVGGNMAVEMPAAFTARLAPGDYSLRPASAGYQSYTLPFIIASSLVDSPLQRIQYHEFSQAPASVGQSNLVDVAEKQAFIRNYIEATARQGFSRETDRKGWSDWARRPDSVPVNLAATGFAPPEFYGIPNGGGWESEYYLDQMSRYGIRYDTQLIGHCGPVCFIDQDLKERLPALQRTAQWLSNYPAFYGFNYNDEMFFGGWESSYGTAPQDWLKQAQDKLGGKRPDALLAALDTMYSSFNGAVKAANPRARTTTTPMWQFPAVEGSYAPTIYQGMDESYSHYLSEGYSMPWYPAHSVEFLKRPGKPIMGVFDNNYTSGDGGLYLKNMMQVLGRGVQGFGSEHMTSLATSEGRNVLPEAASAITAGNRLARMYGAIFAEAPPANEATILYSYAQDVTEHRNNPGTPHWERVFELQGAGLMAGIPMSITYEEDVRAGNLLRNGKPRTPMLFLVGQQVALPEDVQAQIKAYQKAGGKVYLDADSADFPGGTKLSLKTHELGQIYNAGYAADSLHPLAQPVLEKLASGLKTAIGAAQAFPMETSDPWVGKSRLDGAGVQYLVLATETGPFPWAAGDVWSTGAMYNKGEYGSYLPKKVDFSFPFKGGVVYDVFENQIVKPAISGNKATVSADLTTFPGRVFAVAQAPLGAPKLWAKSDGSAVRYAVRILDNSGKTLKGRVPLRIRLLSGSSVVQEFYRGSDENGTFDDTMPLPLGSGNATLEASELLSGKTTSLTLPLNAKSPALFANSPMVSIKREAQVRDLLKRAGNEITLVTAAADVVDADSVQKLSMALAARGITLKTETSIARTPQTGVYLTAGQVQNRGLMGDILRLASQRGLLNYPLTDNVPGAGRGFATAVFAARAYGEDVIALVGGDAIGLTFQHSGIRSLEFT